MARLWHIVWSLSLVAAATVAGVWIACGWCSYVYQHETAGSLDRAVFVEQGHLYLLWAEAGAPSQLSVGDRAGWMPEANGQWWATPAVPGFPTRWSVLGAYYVPGGQPGDLHWLVLPLLWPLLVLLLLPAVQTVRWSREVVRAWRGRCPVCGYDLRASGDTCPECGEPVRGGITADPKPQP